MGVVIKRIRCVSGGGWVREAVRAGRIGRGLLDCCAQFARLAALPPPPHASTAHQRMPQLLLLGPLRSDRRHPVARRGAALVSASSVRASGLQRAQRCGAAGVVDGPWVPCACWPARRATCTCWHHLRCQSRPTELGTEREAPELLYGAAPDRNPKPLNKGLLPEPENFRQARSRNVEKNPAHKARAHFSPQSGPGQAEAWRHVAATVFHNLW